MNFLLKKILICSVMVFSFFCLGPVSVHAADSVVAETMLCASSKVVECSEGMGCEEIALQDVSMPRFIIVDSKNNLIRHAGPGASEKTSKIERKVIIDKKMILQGAEDGMENIRDGLGWTLAISETSGEFVLTASGEEVAFVVFGACTEMP